MRPFLAPLLVLVVGVTQAYPQQQTYYPTPNLVAFMRLVSSLKYNDDCSWANEELRLNHTKSMDTYSSRTSVYGRLRTLALIREVVQKGKKFCSAGELFMCSKNTSKCVCGEIGRLAFFPNATTTTENYVVETDAQGVQRCRWAENSYCLSDDPIRFLGAGSFVNFQCVSGTTCKSVMSGTECTFSTLVQHMRKYPYSTQSSFTRILGDVYNGDVCKCMPNEQSNAIASDSDEDWDDFRRKKRSIREQGPVLFGMETFGPLMAAMSEVV